MSSSNQVLKNPIYPIEKWKVYAITVITTVMISKEGDLSGKTCCF